MSILRNKIRIHSLHIVHMKYIFLLIFLSFLCPAHAQTDTKVAFKAPRSKLWYVSHFSWRLLNVGKEFRFEQRCDSSIEAVIRNGTVVFENTTMYGMKCFHSITLREGILERQLFEIEGKKRAEAFIDSLRKHVPFKKPDVVRLKRGYVLNERISYEDGRIVNYMISKTKDRAVIVISDAKNPFNESISAQ
jgi:hypothetical protein